MNKAKILIWQIQLYKVITIQSFEGNYIFSKISGLMNFFQFFVVVNIFRFGKVLFCWHFSSGKKLFLVTFQHWWHVSFGNFTVSVTLQFLWHFSFGDISVLVTFQFWWHFRFGEILCLVTFQFKWYFSFVEILVFFLQF